METINTIALADEHIRPDDAVLQPVLGNSWQSYQKLLEMYARLGLNPEWRYYHDGKAWLCKVQYKKRTIVWMSAWHGYMQTSIYFPERYMDLVYGESIHDSHKDRFRSTKKVGRSTPCIFEIRNDNVLTDLEKLIQLKIRCR